MGCVVPVLGWKSAGPIHLKAGFLPFSSFTWTFLMRDKLVRTLAMSYRRRTLAVEIRGRERDKERERETETD